jgi:homoserine O-acetyltransferase
MGGTLTEMSVAYETWGRLDERASNAILICHAWTGDSHAAGPAQAGHPTPGWWEKLIGPGLAIDTDVWFVVCANVLGGCQGSTGPASLDPTDSRPYGSRFPVITIRDMVRAQASLMGDLGIDRWHAVVGGSMGGKQVLEWAMIYPDRVRSIIPIATTLQATAQQIAWGSIGRRIIRLDPRWRGGDYYDAAPGDGPGEGLEIARQVAQVTFRSDDLFTDRFGRRLVDRNQPRQSFDIWRRFEVESYLDYHGEKLARRFDANSYLYIGKAMDLHDVARGRGGLRPAIRRIQVPVLSMGITSDILYPLYQQQQIHLAVSSVGVPAELHIIESQHGHDAFLIDHDQVGPAITKFLNRDL